MKFIIRLSICVVFLILPISSCKERPGLAKQDTKRAKLIGKQKKTQSLRTAANSPEEELAGFMVSEGFTIELVASKRDGVMNPIDLNFDDAGRLWTQTAIMYPLDPLADIKWKGLLSLMDNPSA